MRFCLNNASGPDELLVHVENLKKGGFDIESDDNGYFSIIINSIENLMHAISLVEKDFVISHDNQITIYDDYME